MANTLAYYDTATITAVKSFIVQARGEIPIACTVIIEISLRVLSLSVISILAKYIQTRLEPT